MRHHPENGINGVLDCVNQTAARPMPMCEMLHPAYHPECASVGKTSTGVKRLVSGDATPKQPLY